MVSPLNPMSGVVAGTIWFFIYGWSLMKQCSYKTSEDAPPSIYIRCTKCPPISASMIIGPFVPSSSPRGREGNCCLQREGLGDPLFGNLFPWLDHQDGQWLVLSGGFPLLRQPCCMHSSVLCHVSAWNSQYLLGSRFFAGVTIGGGVLNFPFSRAKISFGVFVRKPGDGVTHHTRRRHTSSSDGVTHFKTASARTDSNADLEDSLS
ncbi:hypothetical protein Tco_0625123 [Tanacetum coccineum]|uniref:Uncharacterized protein n=1 Tax=Tanacetum coccineum TaxID=301880 RepID=A0ABQ4WFX6_9ASTR